MTPHTTSITWCTSYPDVLNLWEKLVSKLDTSVFGPIWVHIWAKVALFDKNSTTKMGETKKNIKITLPCNGYTLHWLQTESKTHTQQESHNWGLHPQTPADCPPSWQQHTWPGLTMVFIHGPLMVKLWDESVVQQKVHKKQTNQWCAGSMGHHLQWVLAV